jgi:hypothetical protein
MSQAAHIVGKVEYRQGDGATACIRPGPVEVQTSELDATLSWADGDTRANAAIPLTEFKRHVAKGTIEIVH